MDRRLAVILGSIAFALVLGRGIGQAALAADVVREGLLAMLVFWCIGWIAGRIIDYLIQDSVETRFRQRLARYQSEVDSLTKQMPDSDQP